MFRGSIIALFISVSAFAGNPYADHPGAFVKIPHGTFVMGSPASESGRLEEETQHSVTLTQDFEIQNTDVTQEQWFQVMGNNPSHFKKKNDCPDEFVVKQGTPLCPSHPVEEVSWGGAQTFIAALNAGNDGYIYRLPTEAEWEYAARGGTNTAYSFGEDAKLLGDFGWFRDNSDVTPVSAKIHPVASKKPNPYGLYDVHGGFSNWVQDWYGAYPQGPQTDPMAPPPPGSWEYGHVYRGGAWFEKAQNCRSAWRGHWDGLISSAVLGVRLVRTQR